MTKTSANVIEDCITAIEKGDAVRALVPLIIAEAKARAMEEFATSHVLSQAWIAEVAYNRAAMYRTGEM